MPKVKVLRMHKRSGLIRARLAGAKIAKAEVLLFLDSHTEANVNWLPPLLGEVLYLLSLFFITNQNKLIFQSIRISYFNY